MSTGERMIRLDIQYRMISDVVGCLLSSARSGPFRSHTSWRVPSYEDRNLVAFRHWNPPEA